MGGATDDVSIYINAGQKISPCSVTEWDKYVISDVHVRLLSYICILSGNKQKSVIGKLRNEIDRTYNTMNGDDQLQELEVLEVMEKSSS